MMTGAMSTYTVSVDNEDINVPLVLALGGFVGMLTIVALIVYKFKTSDDGDVAEATRPNF